VIKVKSDLSGLKKLQENMEAMRGTNQVPLSEILNADFVSSHSQYADFDALLTAVGVTTKEEFEAMPDETFDAFLAANTDFESWEDMQRQGAAVYMKAKLLKGLKG
jgi:hypothetical protein